MNRKRVVLMRTNGRHFDPRAERIARSETPGGGDSVVRDSSKFDVSFAIVADAMTVGVGWLVWLLVGALGGLVTLLSAVAIGTSCRRRHRLRPTAAGDREQARAGQRVGGSAGVAVRSRLPRGSAVIGYVIIASGAGDDQEGESTSAIESICERARWELVEVVRDRHSGPSLDRPCLRHALERISRGEAQGLVVMDLQLMSRSIVDLGALMAWFRDADATLIALDLDLDTSTPEGRHVATTLIALSARDHRRIASGTRRGLAKGRASGRPTGRPAVSQRPELAERITGMRAATMTLTAIAEQLNAEGVPTLRGGTKWRPSSIQTALGYRRPSPRNPLPSQNPRAKPSRVARVRSSNP
jgi:DNA invertase Pin-like site-specific DNA recombinase